MRRLFSFVCVSLIVVGVTGVGLGQSYTVEFIEVPDSVSTGVFNLNNQGQLTGRATSDAVPCSASSESFVWTKGQFYHFSFPGAFSTTADGINEKGEVTGSYKLEPPVYNPETGWCSTTPNYGFVRYPDGTFLSVSVPNSRHTVLNKINPSGWMVGPFIEAECYNDPSCIHSFVWKGGTFIQLDVPGGVGTDATDINSRGDVVGVYRSDGYQHGFLFSQGQYQSLQFPGSSWTWVTGINDHGDMVGSAGNPNEGWFAAFVIRRGDFVEITIPDFTNFWPWGINNKGEIAGLVWEGPPWVSHSFGVLLKPKPGKEGGGE